MREIPAECTTDAEVEWQLFKAVVASSATLVRNRVFRSGRFGLSRFGLASSVTGHFRLAVSVRGHFGHDISVHKLLIAVVY